MNRLGLRTEPFQPSKALAGCSIVMGHRQILIVVGRQMILMQFLERDSCIWTHNACFVEFVAKFLPVNDVGSSGSSTHQAFCIKSRLCSFCSGFIKAIWRVLKAMSSECLWCMIFRWRFADVKWLSGARTMIAESYLEGRACWSVSEAALHAQFSIKCVCCRVRM